MKVLSGQTLGKISDPISPDTNSPGIDVLLLPIGTLIETSRSTVFWSVKVFIMNTIWQLEVLFLAVG
jgi:hypothetical protein